MKLIIDIPDKEFQACVRRDANMTGGIADNYIANGIPYEERPQGEWIEGENGSIKCGQCEAEIIYSYFIGNEPNLPNFCCDCGADMRKGGTE